MDWRLFLVLSFNLLVCAQKNLQPKIITDDGNIKFQSATNRNISFELNGDADVNFGGTSLKQIKSTLSQQTTDIKKLVKVSGNEGCLATLCGEHGTCISVLKTSQNQDGYKCICQGLYTGKHCETPDPCAGIHCQNGGRCQEMAGRGVCICSGDWFGLTCSVPKPKACNYVVKEKIGVITSPGYPEGYPSNVDCTWKLEAIPGNILQLVVMVTSIGFSPICTSDFLEIKDLTSDQVLSKICGQIPGKTHLSISSNVQVKFKTGPMPLGLGFSIFYSQGKNEICGGRLTSPSGSFQADKNMMDQPCIWVIDTQSSENLILQFDSLVVNNTEGNCESYVEIRTGDSYSDQLLEKICHSNAPKVLETKSSKLFIKFVSKTNENDLRGRYFAKCGGVVNLKEGKDFQFTSPFYPNQYPKNQNCKWIFQAENSKLITVRLLEVNIEPHDTCSLDKITVENGESVVTFCGNQDMLPITSVSNRMVVTFESDGDNDFKGFKAVASVSDKDCSRSMIGSKGLFHSPLYPSYYGNNKDCVYTINSDDSKHGVQLNFDTFDLEDSEGCLSDYVEIYDGSSTDASKMHAKLNNGRLCGSNRPPVSMSSGRSLTIKFHSNQNINKPGFLATWQKSAYILGCNQVFVSPSGVIKSPLYPSSYPNHLDCAIKIESVAGNKIELEFSYFSLESSVDCENDYLRIYDGPDSKSKSFGKFCGNDSPRKVISSGNYLFIKFKSNKAVSSGGFYAKYTTGTNLCGGTLSGPTGFLNSPGYPSAYIPNAECNWVIQASKGNTIEITITDFELERSADCAKADYLQIYDGEDAGSTLMDTLCGTISNNKTYQSNGQYLYLKFKSNDKVNWKGFTIHYREDCVYTLSKRSGFIMSPNYPFEYPPNKDCTWNIQGFPKERIKIKTLFFDIQNSLDCSNDYLLIGTARFCGTKGPPSSYAISSPTASMRFVSDSSLAGRGFKLSYTLEGCGADFNKNSGSFKSPNYPNIYPADSYCVWRIKVPTGKKIQLQFTDFELEDLCVRDFVSVYNGYTMDAPLMGTYCSRRKSFSLDSTSNEMLVLFKSSLLRQRKGFVANYKVVDGGCGGIITAPTGNFYSPGYPSNYPKNSLCEWKIDVNTTQRLALIVSTTSLSNSDSTQCGDFVEVTDGVTFNKIQTFCLSQTNETEIPTVGNKAIIKFQSANVTQGQLFKVSYKLACGGEIKVGDGEVSFNTPHYPNHYEKGECEWLLTTTPGKTILLRFEDFSTEPCTSCSCDYVKVNDGSSVTSRLIGKYCGETTPANIVSTGNNLFVTFRADTFFQHTGFKAIASSNIATCGGVLTTASGNLVSPLYPNQSPQDADCIWNIKVSAGNRVSFSFTSAFDSRDDCASTYVEIYDGSSTTNTLLSKVCNANIGTIFSSSTNELTVKFFTSKPHAGFSARYDTNCLNIPINATAGSGYIESPGYPNFYPSSSRCQWLLTVPKGFSSTFTFDTFDLEDTTSSCFDYVLMFNRKTSRRATGNLCGQTLPPSLTLRWEQPIVRFISDGFLQRHGFRLRYQVAISKPDCGSSLVATDQPQHFTSPGFPNNYPSLRQCRWKISSYRSDLSVVLIFNSFSLEQHSTCLYDYLEVVKGTGIAPIKFCGNKPSSTRVHSVGSTMIVDFHSDYYIGSSGFNITYTAACYSEEKATKGVIRSYKDNSTQQYVSSSNCIWKIMHQPGSIISLHFKSFDLEQSVNCTKDYLVVKNGLSDSSPIVGKFCGNQIPKDLKVTNHEAMVQFVSNGNLNAAGFEIEFERIIEGCGGTEILDDPTIMYEIKSPNYPNQLPHNSDCEWTLQVPTSFTIEFTFQVLNVSDSAQTSCTETFVSIESGGTTTRYCGLSLNKVILSPSNEIKLRLRTGNQPGNYPGFFSTWKIGCGSNFVSSSGTMKSPNFPKGYISNTSCIYSIQVPETQKQVSLHFSEFDLQGSDNSCGDYVKIYEDKQMKQLIGTYCGYRTPFSITSPSNMMFFEFKSDSVKSSTKGFSADFSTVGLDCGGELSGSGNISSPFYPNNYPIGRKCIWKLSVPDQHSVELKIDELNIAPSVNCTEDYLELRNGETKDSPLIGRYCGQQKPSSFVWSTTSKMRIEFVSNRDNRRGAGFKASFRRGHIGCGGTFNGKSGQITSTGYPTANYASSSNCIWMITAIDPTHVVHLEILDLEIESSESCIFDHLTIRDGSTSDSLLLKTICGKQSQSRIISSSGPNMYIQFVSDIADQFKGFNMTWNTNSIQCGGILHSSNGIIKNPGYPANYTSNGYTDCAWVGELPKDTHAIIKVNEMDIPSSINCTQNRLVIQNGQLVDSPIVATLCGKLENLNHHSFVMSGSHFRIHLISENTVLEEAYRFQLSYSISQLGCGGVLTNDEGIILSPDYPDEYPASSSCQWVIRTSPGKKIFLHVEELDMPDSCLNDNVEIFDGIDLNKKSLGRICGVHINASVFQSTSNTMLLHFRSSFLRSGKGFKLRYSTDCGGILRGRQGFVQSPGFPGRYPENADCKWTVDVQPKYSVRITEADISLPPRNNIGICDRDLVMVREANISGNVIGQFCGHYKLQNFKTEYSRIFINFQSDAVDDGDKYDGGKVSYDTVCGKHIKNSLSGKISLKHSKDYDTNQLCEWIIEFPVGKQISLLTTFFDLEGPFPSCVYDQIEIRDGMNESAPLIMKSCGTQKIPHIQSTSNFLYIKFVSDHSINREGFEFEYSEAKLQCGGSISTASSTNLQSPSYPASYPTQNCGWNIQVPQGKRVELSFNNFAVTTFFGLCVDYLLVYDLQYPNEIYRRSGQLCGSSPPKSIVSISNSMFVYLIADNAVPSFPTRLFNATIKAVEKACGGEFSLGDGETKTLSIKDLANDTSCEYMFTAPLGKHISVKVTSMNLVAKGKDGKCTSNHLILKENFLTTEEVTFCGDNTPPVFQGTNNHIIMMLNNMAPQYFVNIEYSTKEDCQSTYTASNGLVTSPNYPLPYANNLKCEFLMEAPVGEIISLYPTSMNINGDQDTGCPYDSVTIINGDKLNSSKTIGKYCGSNLPASTESSGRYLLIAFSSNGRGQNTGFAFTYLTHKPTECGGLISGQKEGSISTPNYPSYYKANLTCTWNITVGTGKKIDINVKDFESEHPVRVGDCTKVDYLEMFDSNGESLGIFCGSSIPAPRTTSSNTATVKFTSNANINDFRGLRLNFKEV